MNPFEFVLLIILITGVLGIIKAKMGIPHRRGRERQEFMEGPAETGETRALRDEVRQLKERIQVLERITVEKENSLAREIEDLRSRP